MATAGGSPPRRSPWMYRCRCRRALTWAPLEDLPEALSPTRLQSELSAPQTVLSVGVSCSCFHTVCGSSVMPYGASPPGSVILLTMRPYFSAHEAERAFRGCPRTAAGSVARWTMNPSIMSALTVPPRSWAWPGDNRSQRPRVLSGSAVAERGGGAGARAGPSAAAAVSVSVAPDGSVPV